MTPPTILIRGNDMLRRFVYCSPLATRAIFGSWPLPSSDGISFFELCTLAMRRALAQDLRDGMRAAEVGTGPYAVLALWALRRWRIKLVATELEDEWCVWAQQCAARNRLALDVRCCDLLEHADGPFDAIWFVPPFISEESFQAEMKLTRVEDPRKMNLLHLRSCGGQEGWELIERFYSMAAPRLSKGGRIYVAMNRYQQNMETIQKLAENSGLQKQREVTLPLLPYSVLVAHCGGSCEEASEIRIE